MCLCLFCFSSAHTDTERFFQLETCLKHIFAKYCSPSVSRSDKKTLLQPPTNATLSPEGLDAWAKDTNGAPFSQETKDELAEFMDIAEDGSLTLKGFLLIYQLQTENDEEETWRDLSKHGFDRALNLIG
ncbi:uncharacterized protein LACBIDRAFT_305910 [Laccaria bicolor S238N-H82]|uniref:Predicted protein n=1 Tax=Laccaria bicolor (strain S238N-H82 / ATCC MYA-4686) TaxID=486041 RepID=B0CS80_LACBS|nr:uncharacterized protein LACBIDRAFT_305910 [Laccaria bicolor S238N-H82]EDR14258.1 predicted protein [Laccaria bicolor S238N-H82]|eukprot:XP_001874817.1 predicted protein [Laccaria bicolor S238N-H82]